MSSHVKEIITRPSFRLRKGEKFTQINFSIEDKIRLVPASAKMPQPSTAANGGGCWAHACLVLEAGMMSSLPLEWPARYLSSWKVGSE